MGKKKKKYNIEQLMRENELLRTQNVQVAKSVPIKSHHANVCPNNNNMGVGSKKRPSHMGGQKIQMNFGAIICTSVIIFYVYWFYINFM